MNTPCATQDKQACTRSMQIDSLVLPIAPQAVCGRRYGNNKSAAVAMPPTDAVEWIGELLKGGKTIQGVNLCGPGDALAVSEILFTTLDAIRQKYPDLSLQVTCAGLGAPKVAAALAERQVAQVNLQVDSVDAALVEKVYAWVRPGKKTVPLSQSAEVLLKAQEEAVTALSQAGIVVNIQTTVYPGLNEEHVATIAEKMASLGAASMTLLPFEPAPDELELAACSPALLEQVQKAAAAHLRLLDYGCVYLTPPSGAESFSEAMLPKASKDRPNVAVVSANGMEVDLHLGQAVKVLIYGPRSGDDLPSLLEVRDTPEAGAGDSRWEALARECLYDCFALVAAKAGENPQKVLADQGVKVLLAEDTIEGLVDVLYGGGKKKKCKK